VGSVRWSRIKRPLSRKRTRCPRRSAPRTRTCLPKPEHSATRPSRRFKRTGKRNEIFLATKFGLGHGESERFVKADPEYVHEAFNKSMSKLGVDYVDLYYLHRADPTVPIEHTIAEMAKLVK